MLIQKRYKGSELDLLNKVQSALSLLKEHLDSFNKLSTRYTPEYITQLQDLSNEYYQIKTNKELDSIWEVHQQRIVSLRKDIQHLINQIRFFSDQIFNEKLFIKEQFFFRDAPSSKDSNLSMIFFLIHLEQSCYTYKLPLKEQGFPERIYDELKKKREKLIQYNGKISECSYLKEYYTEYRTGILNQLWDHVNLINQAAHIVLGKEILKQKQTELSNKSSGILTRITTWFSKSESIKEKSIKQELRTQKIIASENSRIN